MKRWCALALMWLSPWLARGLGQDQSGGSGGAVESQAAAVPGLVIQDPLARRVVDLPRAQPGQWADLVRAIGSGAGTRGLAPELLAGLGEVEARYRALDYPGALGRAYALLEAAPDLPPALLLLGTTHYRLRRYEDAVEAFDRFLKAAPREVWRTQARGHCLFGLGRFEQAVGHYRAVLELLPESSHARRGLGLALYELGQIEAAAVELERGLAADANSAEMLEALARCRLDLGEPQAALELLERAQDLAPHSARTWFLTRAALEELDREAEAEAVAAIWERVDELTQAVRSVENELLFAADDLELLESLVLLKAALGDVAGGEQALVRALALVPDGAPSNGLLERAFAATSEALTRMPDTQRLIAWRGRLGAALGRGTRGE